MNDSSGICELCRVGNLRPHDTCGGRCAWQFCPACRVTFNPHTHRAYDRDWREVRWPEPA